MTSKDELNIGALTPRTKKNILNDYSQMQKELGKRQREYKNALSMRSQSRSENILEKSCLETVDSLQKERNDLRASIWVANGRCHQLEIESQLEQIRCHINCQENLSAEIKKLKKLIFKMERERSRVDKHIYFLNRKTVPDSQHQEHVACARKKLANLENRLEVGVRRECGFTAANATLREELKVLLDNRAYFNTLYTKLVQHLNVDKKYLLDLLDYAGSTFDGCIDISEKLKYSRHRNIKECEQSKVEMQGLMRNLAATELVTAFNNTKNQTRKIFPLQESEFKRREKFRHYHMHKINLYNSVLAKLYDYTESKNIDNVITMFQQHESIYYSYFTYANETSYHITLLNNAVSRLYEDVGVLKVKNRKTLTDQKLKIIELESKLSEQIEKNGRLKAKFFANEQHLNYVFQNVNSVFKICNANSRKLQLLLGNQAYVDAENMRGYLKALESRLSDVIQNVYIMERADPNRSPDSYVVADIVKIQELITDLDDIVLTQQCPECAEGEIFNIDDAADGGVTISTEEEIRGRLFEKVIQPEMQYCLHSVSQCRLPTSRAISARRNM